MVNMVWEREADCVLWLKSEILHMAMAFSGISASHSFA